MTQKNFIHFGLPTTFWEKKNFWTHQPLPPPHPQATKMKMSQKISCIFGLPMSLWAFFNFWPPPPPLVAHLVDKVGTKEPPFPPPLPLHLVAHLVDKVGTKDAPVNRRTGTAKTLPSHHGNNESDLNNIIVWFTNSKLAPSLAVVLSDRYLSWLLGKLSIASTLVEVYKIDCV